MRIAETQVYKFDELSDKAKKVAILEHINFEIDTMDKESFYWPIAVRMEKMKTTGFLAETIWDECKDDIVETIKVNEYEFKENGIIY